MSILESEQRMLAKDWIFCCLKLREEIVLLWHVYERHLVLYHFRSFFKSQLVHRWGILFVCVFLYVVNGNVYKLHKALHFLNDKLLFRPVVWIGLLTSLLRHILPDLLVAHELFNIGRLFRFAKLLPGLLFRCLFYLWMFKLPLMSVSGLRCYTLLGVCPALLECFFVRGSVGAPPPQLQTCRLWGFFCENLKSELWMGGGGN